MTPAANHVPLFTTDLDALVDFYVDVFGAEVVGDWGDGALRHAFIEVSRDTTLHPVEVAGSPRRGSSVLAARTKGDQLTITVSGADEFDAMRRRLVELGASDGRVTGDAATRHLRFVDPGGFVGVISHSERDDETSP